MLRGIYALAAGCHKDAISGVQTLNSSIIPSVLNEKCERWMDERFDAHEVCDIYRLYFANDCEIGGSNEGMTEFKDPTFKLPNSEKERERIITEVFARHNVKVEFIN